MDQQCDNAMLDRRVSFTPCSNDDDPQSMAGVTHGETAREPTLGDQCSSVDESASATATPKWTARMHLRTDCRLFPQNISSGESAALA